MKLRELVKLHTRENILSEATIHKYHSVVSTFINDTGVDCIFIDHDTILNWRDDILNRSSAGNWNNYHRHLRALLQTALNFELIKENPFKEVKAVTHYPSKQYLLSDQDIKKLLKFCQNIDYGWFWSCVITTLHYTGIRRKQLVGLTWADFDLDNKQLRLQTSSSKTKRAYTIPIKQRVVDCILLVKEKTRHTPQDGNNQIFNITLINPRFKTNRMNVEHLAKFFVNTSKKTNIADSSHRFRHTFATKLANNGQTSIKTVQNLLGHSSVHTTLGYVHPSMDDMRQAVSLL
jgi:integrase